MPDIGQRRFEGDLSFILKKSFDGDLVSASRLSITDNLTESFVVKLAGTASKDTYLTKATLIFHPGDQGVTATCYLVRQTLLTGQPTRTITTWTTFELITTSVAHGFAVGDLVEFDGVTNGSPDINSPSMFIVESIPSSTTFRIFTDERVNESTNGTVIKRYAKSNEIILEIFKMNLSGDSNNGGSSTPEKYNFDAAVGQKISASEEFLMYQVGTSITQRQLIGSGSIIGIIVDTDADPTVV